MNAKKFSREVTVWDSTNIRRIGYDPSSNELQIEFLNGGTYLYKHVSSAEFGYIVSADSVGKAVAQVIKNVSLHPAQKVG